MIIYSITNKVSGKVYIGQTRRPKRRWYEHLHNLNTYVSLIDRALQKYGPDSFEYKEIDTADSIEELNIKEEEWILKLNTIHPNGYNLVLKGRTCIVSEHTKAKQSEVQKRLAAERGVSQETRDKISKVHKGVPKSAEQIAKMKANHRTKLYPPQKLGKLNERVGVRHRVDPDKYIDQYIAFITIDGVSKSKCFAVKKYGETEAKALAIAQRILYEKEMTEYYKSKLGEMNG